MSKISNQSNSLYSIECVQDIDHESAAAISGGALEVTDVTLYSEADLGGFQFGSNKAIEDLTEFGFDDATGSITVANDKTWRFYSEAGLQGEYIDVGPGQSVNAGDFGMTISSFQAI
ncbi:MAG: beta/gamma crystallin-related protein [Waterburya sp.]